MNEAAKHQLSKSQLTRRQLTKRQSQVLEFITHYVLQHNYPPSTREISQNFSISSATVQGHVQALEKKGYVQRRSLRNRALKVYDLQMSQNREIPILGTIRAGLPTHAEQEYDGTVSVPSGLLSSGEHFALRVRGDSMTGAGILEGDLVIIREQNIANNGDIVVAYIDDTLTLKRYFKEKNRIRLQAENPAYQTIYTQSIRILGCLVQLMRSY